MTALFTAIVLLVPLAGALPASAAPTADGEPAPPPPRGERAQYVEGELLVRFDPGTPENRRSDVRRRHQLDKICELPVPGLELVSFRGQGTPPVTCSRTPRRPARSGP